MASNFVKVANTMTIIAAGVVLVDSVQQVGDFEPLADNSSLDAIDVHPVDPGETTGSFTSQSDHIDVEAVFRQRLGVTHDAVVRLVKRIRDDAGSDRPRTRDRAPSVDARAARAVLLGR